jgi:hypothetical protein
MQLQAAMGSCAVVVLDVLAKHPLEVAATENDQPVQAFPADAADPAFGVTVRDWDLEGVRITLTS